MGQSKIIDEIINSDSNILIDMDETAFDFMPGFVPILNKRHNLNLEVSDIVHYHMELIKPLRELGITFDKILDDLRYFGNTEEFVHIPTIPGFMEFYKLVTHDFNNLEKIYIVTSRSEEFYDFPREKTIETLNNSNVPFIDKNLVLTENKHDFAIKNNIKVIFDDSIYVAKPFLTNNYVGHIVMNNTAANNISKKAKKDKMLLEPHELNKKRDLVKLTYDPRVTRMNGWYELLNGKKN